jgi:hypothetical protein
MGVATSFAMPISGAAGVPHTFSRRAPSSRKVCKVCNMTRSDPPARARQNPFRLFRVISSEDASNDVRHLDWIVVNCDAVTISVTADPTQDYSDSTVMFGLFNVVGLEPMEAPALATGNRQ